ncbi:MAG: hypothetical protein IIB69_14285 [Proteobacteria bacterium]|nr:hypothetical protein [Pseudomonadota bacterium]
MRLIVTLDDNPQFLPCALADFQSRLSWGLLLQLPATEDSAIERIVRQRANMLGFDLSNEVMAYLLTRYSRRLSVQIDILRLLDAASLSAQKKITVPLIKQTLGASDLFWTK